MIFLSRITYKPICTNNEKKKTDTHYCSYFSVSIGKNIQIVSSRKDENISVSTIELSRTKHKQVIFAACREELETMLPNRLIFIPSVPIKKNKNHGKRETNLSGLIMLCSAVIDNNNVLNITWDTSDFNKLKRTKHLVVGNKNTPHFGAKGYYFSSGLSAVYKVTNNSSVQNYGVKKHSDATKMKERLQITKEMDKKLV